MMQTQTVMGKQSARRAISQSAEGYPLLGQVVYWTMEDVNVSKFDFINILTGVGIDPKEHLNDIRFKSVVGRAIKAAIKDRGDKRIRVQKAIDDEKQTVWAVFFIDLDDQGEVKLQNENKIILHKDTERVEIKGPDEQEIRRYITDLGGVYRTEDFRKFILNYMKKNCSVVTIRDRGGMYFVPSTREDNFQKVVCLYDAMRNCELNFIPVIDTAQAKKSVWKSIVGDKLEALQELKENIEDMPQKDAKQYLVERRIDEFKTLKSEVGMFDDLFTLTNEELKNSLSQVEKALYSRLS
jgi:hypothetical protein